MHRSMSGARRRDDLAQAAYEEGLKEGRRAKKPAAKATKAGKGAARRLGASAGRPVRQGLRQGARQLQAPLQAQVASGVKVVGFMLGLTFLYLVLTTAEKPQFTGKIDGLIATPKRVVDWLTAPNRSIPYAGGK